MAVKQVQRYIRLNELVPDLMALMDAKKLGFTTAVELSYVGAPKDFDRIAKIFEVDYAFRKVSPGHYLLFFKAAQAGDITQAMQKYSEKVLHKGKEQPSILGQLRKFTELIKAKPKEKQRTREAVKDGR